MTSRNPCAYQFCLHCQWTRDMRSQVKRNSSGLHQWAHGNELTYQLSAAQPHVRLSFHICLVMLGCCPKWAHTHSRNQHCSYSIFDSLYCPSLSPHQVTDPTIELSVCLEPRYPEHGLFIVVSGMPFSTKWKELLVASLAVHQHRVMWKSMRQWLLALSIDFGIYSNNTSLRYELG